MTTYTIHPGEVTTPEILTGFPPSADTFVVGSGSVWADDDDATYAQIRSDGDANGFAVGALPDDPIAAGESVVSASLTVRVSARLADPFGNLPLSPLVWISSVDSPDGSGAPFGQIAPVADAAYDPALLDGDANIVTATRDFLDPDAVQTILAQSDAVLIVSIGSGVEGDTAIETIYEAWLTVETATATTSAGVQRRRIFQRAL